MVKVQNLKSFLIYGEFLAYNVILQKNTAKFTVFGRKKEY